VREILDSLPEEERVAYTTVQTLVYRLGQKGAVRKVKKNNAQLFESAIDRSEYRGVPSGKNNRRHTACCSVART
jgi:predicted transcriptional regulator